jgi:hypothetical protein
MMTNARERATPKSETKMRNTNVGAIDWLFVFGIESAA